MFYVVSPEILINKVFWLISCLLVWLFTANLEVLLKFFLFLFFIFAFGLSKLVVFAQIWALFLMSVNSELYWFLVGADTATSGSGKSETTGQTIFCCRTQKMVSPSRSVSQLPFFSICKPRGRLQVSTACLQFSQILYPKLSKLFHESDEVFSLIFFFFFFSLRLF